MSLFLRTPPVLALISQKLYSLFPSAHTLRPRTITAKSFTRFFPKNRGIKRQSLWRRPQTAKAPMATLFLQSFFSRSYLCERKSAVCSRSYAAGAHRPSSHPSKKPSVKKQRALMLIYLFGKSVNQLMLIYMKIYITSHRRGVLPIYFA